MTDTIILIKFNLILIIYTRSWKKRVMGNGDWALGIGFVEIINVYIALP
ncbi:MAG: hypothetical protein HC785_23540 [Calothrix sp. CSU_2_0]|nr:hypothetical protein [Calothrix sp. CSU_2_0]